MKKTLILFSALLIALSGCKKQRTIQEEFVKEAQEETKKYCPVLIDEGIVYDSCAYSIKENRLRYYYTLDEPYNDEESIQTGRVKFREALRQRIMSSLDMKKHKDNDVTFEYVYYSKAEKNKILLKEVFTAEDYKLNNAVKSENDPATASASN